jgi:hypothetical protein
MKLVLKCILVMHVCILLHIYIYVREKFKLEIWGGEDLSLEEMHGSKHHQGGHIE